MQRFTFDLHEGAGGGTYVRTVDDVMVIKPNFLASMGYQYFLSYLGARGAPLIIIPTFPTNQEVILSLEQQLKFRENLCIFISSVRGLFS